MKRIIFVTIALIALLSGSFNIAAADEEFQNWLTVGIKSDINEKVDLKLEEEFRFGNDYYYNHTDLGAGYKISDNFYLGLNYALRAR